MVWLVGFVYLFGLRGLFCRFCVFACGVLLWLKLFVFVVFVFGCVVYLFGW